MQPMQWGRNAQLQAEAEEKFLSATEDLSHLAETLNSLPADKDPRKATKELTQLAEHFSDLEPYGGKIALIKKTKELLDHGANPNILHVSKYSHYAEYPIARAIPEHPEIVELLLQAGANPNTISFIRKDAIIFKAIDHNKVDIVKSLLRHNANPNVTEPVHNLTPLNSAILSHRDPAIINLLIQHHADPNKASVNGTLPLTLAVVRADIHLIKLLLQAGANPDAYNKKINRSVRNLVLGGTRSTDRTEKARYQLILDLFNMYSAQKKAKIL
jgi:hypothetical protein